MYNYSPVLSETGCSKARQRLGAQGHRDQSYKDENVNNEAFRAIKNLTKKYSVVLGGKPWRDRGASGTAVQRQVWGCLLVPSPELHVGDGGNNKAYKVYLTLHEAALSQEEMVQISEIKERGLAHNSEYLQYKILMNFSRVEKFDHVRSQVRNMAD